jgi:lambda family phage portal protein
MNVEEVIKGIARLRGEPPAARRVAPAAFSRMYANARPTMARSGFASPNTSADAELISSLLGLRAKSRQLVRDAAFAKNARRIIQNNVIGTGIRLQSFIQTVRGTLATRQNDAVEEAWEDWCCGENCHTGGEVHFHDLERLAVGQVFEAGEIFLRIHRSAFGKSKVPIALEIIEAERVLDGFTQPTMGPADPGNTIRMGIEHDKFGRPVAYYVRDLHPGDPRTTAGTNEFIRRIPAEDMFHLRVIDRWPQTRGEPWLHAVAGKLGDMNGYSEAEIIAARGGANYLATIETPDGPDALGEKQDDGSFDIPLQPGTVERLAPGETLKFVSPNRPNSALEPFMRFMLREVAAGAGVSYESISRDYSQSNYSSTRLALLDDRDVWKTLQQWFIRSFRCRMHEEWMQAAVLAQAIPEIDIAQYVLNRDKYEAAIFRPRGWSWIDPTKEVAAYKEAVKAGFTTVGAVIAQTSGGDDLEDIMRTRHDELEYMDELDLAFDTSPEVYVPAETRGQMIVGPNGSVVAAQQPVGPDGKPVAAPVESETTETPPVDDTEPAGAEDDEERGLRRVARILRFRKG